MDNGDGLIICWKYYYGLYTSIFARSNGLKLKLLRDSSPKKDNSVINYSPSVRPSFIFRTQINIFLMNSESSLFLSDSKVTTTIKAQKNVARTLLK